MCNVSAHWSWCKWIKSEVIGLQFYYLKGKDRVMDMDSMDKFIKLIGLEEHEQPLFEVYTMSF